MDYSSQVSTQSASMVTGKKANKTQHAKSGGHLFVPRRWHRPIVLKWLRRTHAWLGLWGMALGLLFGVTGFLLNHRTTMKISAAKNDETTLQIALKEPLPTEPKELIALLQKELQLNIAPSKPRIEEEKPAPWGDGQIQQPERWQINFVTNRETVTTEYWVGNHTVFVKRATPNAWGWLTRLHMATGASVGWILLADTLAGGMIILSITGVLLWTRLHGPRLLGIGLISTCLILGLFFAAV